MNTAREIVNALIGRGFTQTDIARGLELLSKGSGSYVGQVAKGAKSGAQHVEPLRAMLAAVGGRQAPAGRKAAETRQQMLRAPEVQPVRRTDAQGRRAGVRKAEKFHAATKGKRKGQNSMRVVAGPQGLASGGRAIADGIEALALYNGRFSLMVVGRFAPGHAAPPAPPAGGGGSNFRPRYRPSKRPGLRKVTRNTMTAEFANNGKGFVARDWEARIAQAGSFTAALHMWAEATAQVELPDRIDRVELYGTPEAAPWNQRA